MNDASSQRSGNGAEGSGKERSPTVAGSHHDARRHYQACPLCTAKWFARVPLAACPRCGCSPPLSDSLTDSELGRFPHDGVTSGRESTCPICQIGVTSSDSDFGPTFEFLGHAWPLLPPHIREAIITLIDCATRGHQREGDQ